MISFKPIVRFGVMSDTHYCAEHSTVRERFGQVMRFLYDYADSEDYKGFDALYVVGDLTDRGHTDEFEQFAEDCHRNVRQETKLIVTMANHDLHYIDDYRVAQSDFTRCFGMPFDRHEVIKGFHFISLSTIYDKGPWHDSYNEEKRQFLKDELVKARDQNPKLPIFVFQHTGVKGTTPGATFGNNEIHSILCDFPQVIDFSGHSHYAVNDPKEIHQKHFTSVTTGSLFNISTAMSDAYHSYMPGSDKYAHMILVEADSSGMVRIRRVDAAACGFFENDSYIVHCYNPNEFVYTEQRASTAAIPYFADNATVSVKRNNDKLIVTFPQAVCKSERVREYFLRVIREDGTTLFFRTVLSDFPALHMSPTRTVEIDSMPSEKLTIEIRASGFWSNVSKPVYGVTE